MMHDIEKCFSSLHLNIKQINYTCPQLLIKLKPSGSQIHASFNPFYVAAPTKNGSNRMWPPTKFIPPGIRILTDQLYMASESTHFFFPSYLATPTEMNPIAFKLQLN